MSGLEFISRWIAALAWPLAIVVILVVFHRPLSELLKRVEKVEYQGLILQLTKEATEAAAKLGTTMAEEGLVSEEMAKATPFAAMTVSWLLLDQEAAQLVEGLDLREEPKPGAAHLAVQLALERPGERQFKLAGVMVTLLRVYQEAERHPTEVSFTAAWDYTRAALAIRDELRELATIRHA